MTAQVSDGVSYQGETYALVGVAGQGLFDPPAHGLEPVMIHTGCWRGFVAHYAVGDDGWLRLAELTIRLPDESMEAAGRGELPLLGRQPQVGHTLVYAELGEVAFTGGLLLGADFVRELYVHMGYHPAWKYGRLLELVFEAGRLQETLDHSAAAAALRDAGQERTRERELAWARDTFRCDYAG